MPGLASEAAEERHQVVSAVFLDRDGVINANLERNGKPVAPTRLSEFRILPGVVEATRLLKEAGYLLIVVTNQPDVANGLTPKATVEAMQSGLYHGYVGLVDGILKKMIAELGGSVRVVATGGLAPLIAKGSTFIQEVDETLTLEGLRLVYERTR